MSTRKFIEVSRKRATTTPRPTCISSNLKSRKVTSSKPIENERKRRYLQVRRRNRLRSKLPLSNNKLQQGVESVVMAAIVNKDSLALAEKIRTCPIKRRLHLGLVDLEQKFYDHEADPAILQNLYKEFHGKSYWIKSTDHSSIVDEKDSKLIEKDLKEFISKDDSDKEGITNARDRLWNTVDEVRARTKEKDPSQSSSLKDKLRARELVYSRFLDNVLDLIVELIKKKTDDEFKELHKLEEWTIHDLLMFQRKLGQMYNDSKHREEHIDCILNISKCFNNFFDDCNWTNVEVDDFKQKQQERIKMWIDTCHEDNYEITDLQSNKSYERSRQYIMLGDGSFLPEDLALFVIKSTKNEALLKNGGSVQLELYRLRCVEIATDFRRRAETTLKFPPNYQEKFLFENIPCAVIEAPPDRFRFNNSIFRQHGIIHEYDQEA